MPTDASFLCGLHSTYITLWLLGDKGRDVHEIYRAFPDIKEKGVSLVQISDFLRNKKYFCVLRTVSDSEMISA